MIHVEIRTTTGTETGYRVAAELNVNDDGSYDIHDPEHLVPLQLEVPVPPSVDGGHPIRVSFADNPITWARHLGNLLRTPYLHAVVTADTHPK